MVANTLSNIDTYKLTAKVEAVTEIWHSDIPGRRL